MPEKKGTKKSTAKKAATKKKATKKTTAAKSATKTAKKATTKKKTTVKKALAPASGPAAASAEQPAPRADKKGPAKLRVKQVRSTIHKPKTFKRTLVALGLRHHQDEVVVTDIPSTRGMLTKVRHLVSVTPEDG